MLPLGMFSEEAQESRNKDNKQFRLHHARTDSREHTMEDKFHYLLITSDPLISSLILQNETEKNKSLGIKMSPEALALLEKEEDDSEEDAEVIKNQENVAESASSDEEEEMENRDSEAEFETTSNEAMYYELPDYY